MTHEFFKLKIKTIVIFAQILFHCLRSLPARTGLTSPVVGSSEPVTRGLLHWHRDKGHISPPPVACLPLLKLKDNENFIDLLLASLFIHFARGSLQFCAALRLIENTFLSWAATLLAASHSGPSRSVSGVCVFHCGGEEDKG